MIHTPSRILCAALAALLLAAPLPAMAQEAQTAETAQTEAAQGSRIPADVTEEELAYTHIALYEPVLEDGTLAFDTYAVSGYSTANADTAYAFLRNECGMNAAQAAGVMASIYTESRFVPTAYNGNDSGGTQSYGICQWNSTRYDALRNWCAANGYDYTTLDGQLHYLKYELTETWEKQVYTRTDTDGNCFGTVPDTRDGAWAAGYTFSRYFGRGAASGWAARGDYAQEFYDLYSGWGAVDTAQVTAFVTRLYTVCLGRQPDAAGLADWVNRLSTRSITGTQAAYGFIFSAEFKAKNYCNSCYVKQLYYAFMGREYDAGGLQYWVNVLQGGTTREGVFNGFAASAEFAAICSSYGITQGSAVAVPQYGTVPTGACTACGEQDGVTKFVTRLYTICLGRAPDSAGLADWTGRLWAHTASGRTVAEGFIFSQEFTAMGYNNDAFVERLYEAFMGRASDTAGKADWVGRLNAGTSREAVFDGFAQSAEFSAICNSYGIVRG